MCAGSFRVVALKLHGPLCLQPFAAAVVSPRGCGSVSSCSLCRARAVATMAYYQPAAAQQPSQNEVAASRLVDRFNYRVRLFDPTPHLPRLSLRLFMACSICYLGA